MKIQLWYNEKMGQWRWTLCSDDSCKIQESGMRANIYEAMEDIARTVEFLLSK